MYSYINMGKFGKFNILWIYLEELLLYFLLIDKYFEFNIN